jgi:hypothetical protein
MAEHGKEYGSFGRHSARLEQRGAWSSAGPAGADEAAGDGPVEVVKWLPGTGLLFVCERQGSFREPRFDLDTDMDALRRLRDHLSSVLGDEGYAPAATVWPGEPLTGPAPAFGLADIDDE